MPARPALLRALVLLVALVLGHALPPAARPLAAQLCSEDPTACSAPRVTITPASMTWSGTQAVSELPVVIEWCDELGLDPESRVVRLDGVAVATSWSTLTRTTGCFSHAESPVTVPVGPGTHTLTAEIQDRDGITGSASAVFTYTYTPPPDTTTPPSYSVAVTPDGGSARRGAGEASAEVFAVRNTGTGAARFRLQPVCAGAGVTGCAAQLDSVVLAPGATATVGVAYRAAAAGGTGTVWLKAWKSDAAAVRDSGSVVVTAAAAAEPGNVGEAGDNTRLDRGDCVTAGAFGGAYECGDLRLAYGLPVTRVLNTPRSPVLLYNSQHARPHPVVAAHFAPPAGAAPTEVGAVLSLKVGSSARTASRVWPGWAAGETRRIAVGLDAAGVGTGVYDYTLEITARYADGTTRLFPRTGRLVVVDRSASPFGAGWWMAGVEQLFHPADGSKLWVGGDGSTRLYRPTGTPNSWAADAYDRPDALTYNPSTGIYTRALPGGVEVRFNGDGRHLETRNKAGHVSAFEWTGALLTRIHLPRAPSFNTGYAYVLAYTGSPARLSSVTAPGNRVVDWRTDASQRVTMVIGTAPDTVRFGYADATARVTRRTDRMGVAVDFGYDAAFRLGRATHTMGTAATGDDRVLTFRAAEGLGTTATPATQVYTLLDGPRSDVGDSTRVTLDRRGAPVRVTDPLNFTTTLTRGDPAWPGLVTKVRHPTGRELTAAYDGRGNLAASTDWAVPTAPVTTSYAWDPRWDAVTRVTAPGGEVTTVAYDSVTGARLWEQTGPAARKVSYRYHSMSSAASPGLLASVTTAVRTDTFTYDGRGNLRTTPLETHWADALGRDTLIQTLDQTKKLRYNGAELVEAEILLGGDSVVVASEYDREGRTLRTTRQMFPDPNGIGVLTLRWEYDAAGRVRRALDAGGAADSTVYDAAGNAVEVHGRRSDAGGRQVVRMEYDALGRLTKRITPAAVFDRFQTTRWGREWSFPSVPLNRDAPTLLAIPADTAVFVYDTLGNLKTANNRDARIARTYDAHGRLATETQAIREATGQLFIPYLFRYDYDQAGRLRRVRYPSQLVIGAGDSIVYRYDAATGELAEVRDLGGSLFRFSYDDAGRLATLRKPGGITESYGYDDADQLSGIALDAVNPFVGTASGFAAQRVRGTGIERLGTHIVSAMENAKTGVQAQYGPFGGLTYWLRLKGTLQEERKVLIDPLGNVAREIVKREAYENGDIGNAYSITTDTLAYVPGVGRLGARYTLRPAPMSGYDAETYYSYDAAGNQLWTRESRGLSGTSAGEQQTYQARSWSYHDAAGRLRVHDVQACITQSYQNAQPLCTAWQDGLGLQPGVAQEYRYDALGRRVWVRSTFDPQCTRNCASYEERTLWSGDQIAGEDRGLTVAYTHGPGIDAPLSLLRAGKTVVPHANWRGMYDSGTYPDGSFTTGGEDLRTVGWPGENVGAWAELTVPYVEEKPWYGSLIGSMRDASGMLYRRNRYYDPGSGRFTQEDPIGLAGGLNLYAMGGGDAVSYTDPYGLCPMCLVYGGFEVASTIYDLGDLAVTGVNYLRGRASGREVAVTAAGAAAGVFGFGGGYGTAARQLSRRLPFADADRLAEINKTLDRMDDGVKRFTQDGTVFRNREGRLPQKADGYYQEWTVETPGATNRGARRVVQGQGGETYYTDDHYKTFVRIDPRKH